MYKLTWWEIKKRIKLFLWKNRRPKIQAFKQLYMFGSTSRELKIDSRGIKLILICLILPPKVILLEVRNCSSNLELIFTLKYIAQVTFTWMYPNKSLYIQLNFTRVCSFGFNSGATIIDFRRAELILTCLVSQKYNSFCL
jgi:hypothetical protein